MNTSLKGQYALLALFDLARQGLGMPVKIADIAKRQKIPQKFLELILAGLKQGGFVESRRGAEGGYMLVRHPESLSVGEVLRVVEGSRRSFGEAARRKWDGPLTELWRQVDAAISSVIDNTTLADLVRKWEEKQSKYVPNWEI
jgi:Rrf2 family cysteine metabolism transcriptional repressor